jgi:hypothetical protein
MRLAHHRSPDLDGLPRVIVVVGSIIAAMFFLRS